MKTTDSSSKIIKRQPNRNLQPWSGALAILAMACALVWFCGCQQPQPVFQEESAIVDMPAPTEVTPATAPTASASTRLQAGDAVRVSFEGETNLNTVAKIQLDGNIWLPMVGEVNALGKTLTELQADLTQRYQRLLKVSEITVAIAATSASVYVSGAVLKPGRIPLDRPLTALEAIMEAGGFDHSRANPSKVVILRLENGRQMHYRVNLKKALQGEDTQPFQLKPFDIVHVPEKVFNL